MADVLSPIFCYAWEQRKVGDIADLLTGFPFESKLFSENGILLIRGMNVKRGYIDDSPELCEYWESDEGLQNYLLQEDDIVIQMDGALIGRSYALVKAEILPALLVQRVTRIRTGKKSAKYIYYCIQRGFLKYIKGLKTETAVPHLSLKDIADYTIPMPKDDAEIQRIGDYFQQLDHLIALHQRKCTISTGGYPYVDKYPAYRLVPLLLVTVDQGL